MTTTFSALDWRTMSQDERDLGFNNGVAVPESVAMVAGWEQRSADMRKRYPDHIDLRYGPRERNRIDFLKVRDNPPTLLFIHGGPCHAPPHPPFPPPPPPPPPPPLPPPPPPPPQSSSPVSSGASPHLPSPKYRLLVLRQLLAVLIIPQFRIRGVPISLSPCRPATPRCQ